MQAKANTNTRFPLGPLLFGPSLLFLSSSSIVIVNSHALSLHEIDVRQLLILMKLGQIAGLVIFFRDAMVYFKCVAEGVVLNKVLGSRLSPMLQGCCSIMGLYALPITTKQREELIRVVTSWCYHKNIVDLRGECNALLEPGGYVKYFQNDILYNTSKLTLDHGQTTTIVTSEFSTASSSSTTTCSIDSSPTISEDASVEIMRTCVPSVSLLQDQDQQSDRKLTYSNEHHNVALSSQEHLWDDDLEWARKECFDIGNDIWNNWCKNWLEDKLPSETTLKTVGIMSSFALIFQLKYSKSARRIATNTIQAGALFTLIGGSVCGTTLAHLRQACSRSNSHNTESVAYENYKWITFIRSHISNSFTLRLSDKCQRKRVRDVFTMMFTFYLIKNRATLKRAIFGNRNRRHR